jgi:hypothetical protein
VCINTDKAWFADHGIAPPTTLEDLVKPEYDGLLVTENPATSSPGLAFLLATIAHFGEDGWRDYWAQLRSRDVDVVAGWEQAYNGVQRRRAGDRRSSCHRVSRRRRLYSDRSRPTRPSAPCSPAASGRSDGRRPEGDRASARCATLVDFMLSSSSNRTSVAHVRVQRRNAASRSSRSSRAADRPAVAAHKEIGTGRWIDEWTETVLQ